MLHAIIKGPVIIIIANMLRVGAPGTTLCGKKGRTRKEDKIVLDMYVDAKFVDRKEIQQCHEDTWPFMSDNVGCPTSQIRRLECIYITGR